MTGPLIVKSSRLIDDRVHLNVFNDARPDNINLSLQSQFTSDNSCPEINRSSRRQCTGGVWAAQDRRQEMTPRTTIHDPLNQNIIHTDPTSAPSIARVASIDPCHTN